MNEQEKRKQALARLKAQRAFWTLFGTFVIVWLILTGVWFLSGGGYFWPAWAIFGMCIALAFTGWNAYGPQQSGISEAEIDREVKKMDQ